MSWGTWLKHTKQQQQPTFSNDEQCCQQNAFYPGEVIFPPPLSCRISTLGCEQTLHQRKEDQSRSMAWPRPRCSALSQSECSHNKHNQCRNTNTILNENTNTHYRCRNTNNTLNVKTNKHNQCRNTNTILNVNTNTHYQCRNTNNILNVKTNKHPQCRNTNTILNVNTNIHYQCRNKDYILNVKTNKHNQCKNTNTILYCVAMISVQVGKKYLLKESSLPCLSSPWLIQGDMLKNLKKSATKLDRLP